MPGSCASKLLKVPLCHAGGRLHIHITSDGLKKDAETFPDLHVTLKTQGLHAPLVERFVELPMDITAGALPSQTCPSHCIWHSG